MRSIKAILAGIVFIIVVMLLLQLAYIFVAVGYNALAKEFPFLNEIAGMFRYILGIPLFIATMFIGGYITANIANMVASVKIWLHCLVVGLITSVAMLYPTLENAEITITGIVVFVLSLVAATGGGLYWQKNIRMSQH